MVASKVKSCMAMRTPTKDFGVHELAAGGQFVLYRTERYRRKKISNRAQYNRCPGPWPVDTRSDCAQGHTRRPRGERSPAVGGNGEASASPLQWRLVELRQLS